MPLVSVIMPAYNCEQTLEAAAASVFSQTVSGWELIIVDDASRDGTAALANNLCARDPRVRLVTNERNLGVAASRNRGIRLAKGDYLAFLDSDDRWQPKKLELQLARLEKTQADLCYTSYQLCDPARPDVIKLYRVPPGIGYRALLKENVIGCSTVLMRARRMPAQGFPCAFFHEDYALWLKLLRSGCRAVGMEEPLVSYRTGGRSSNKLLAAVHRWEIYRRSEGLSLPACCYLSRVLRCPRIAETRPRHFPFPLRVPPRPTAAKITVSEKEAARPAASSGRSSAPPRRPGPR